MKETLILNQRIKKNFKVDHLPKSFLENIDLFKNLKFCFCEILFPPYQGGKESEIQQGAVCLEKNFKFMKKTSMLNQ